MKLLNVKTVLKLIVPFLALIMFMLPLATAAQDMLVYKKIDSIENQLKNSLQDSNRVKAIIDLSTAYLSISELNKADFDKLFKNLQQASLLCDSHGSTFDDWKVKCLYLTGEGLIRCNKVEEGKNVFIKLAQEAHTAGDKHKEARSWQKYAECLITTNKIDRFEHEVEIACANAINVYREIPDKRGEIDVSIQLAGLHGRNAEFKKAEEEFLDIVKKSKDFGAYRLPVVYYLLAAINRYTGSYNKALEYALRGITTMEQSRDSGMAETYYGELAEIYQALDKPVESVTWYKKCIEKRELLVHYPSFNLYRTYSLLVSQLIKCGAQGEALKTIKNLQKRRPPNSFAESAVLFQSMAYCYDANNAYDSTEKYLVKTLESYRISNEKQHMVEEIMLLADYDIAKFYVKHKRFIKAQPYLDSILANTQSINTSTLADVHLLRFEVDSAAGSYVAAIKHFQQYKTITDSIFNDKKSRQIEELQIAYNTEKKDEQIGFLTKKDQLQQANLRQANVIKNWMAASAALLILLLAVGYNRYRLKQKTNKQLEAQQIIINQKNVSLLRLVNEKEWLMKEIHHRVKNNFHIVTGLLGTQSGYLKNEEAIAAVKESQQRIHAMSLIHQKLYQSESLSSIDMPGYIHELVDYLKESFDKSDAVRFHFQLHRISLVLSHVIPIGLILNEAITNAFKYAFTGQREGNIYLSFLRNAGNIVLMVRDDGAGLPPGFDYKNSSSMGLNLMKGLSDDIDGSFTIQNNNGTVVTVSFAYNPDMPGDITPVITG